MRQIRILLVDDHPAFMAGIHAELEKEHDMLVVGRAPTGMEALRLVRSLQPDVLLLDMQLPDLSGVDIARQLKDENSPVLVLPLSGFSDAEYVTGVLEAGAAGYMTKDESISDIVRAVRKVADGGVHISSRVAIDLVNEQRHRLEEATRKDRITEELRDLGFTSVLVEVIQLVAQGLNDQQVAEQLSRSKHTIRNHVDRLRRILGMRWRPELVAWAWRHGVMEVAAEDFE